LETILHACSRPPSLVAQLVRNWIRTKVGRCFGGNEEVGFGEDGLERSALMYGLRLKDTLSATSPALGGDVLNMKNALSALGEYNAPSHGTTAFTDDAMFTGIRNVQRKNGLRVDGVARPGGPTEVVLNAGLAQQSIGSETRLNPADRMRQARDQRDRQAEAEREQRERIHDPMSHMFRYGVGEGQANAGRDVIALKNALAWTGHYPVDRAQQADGSMDEALRWGLWGFQRDFNLTQDGFARPGGETEHAITQIIAPQIQLAAMTVQRDDIGFQHQEMSDNDTFVQVNSLEASEPNNAAHSPQNSPDAQEEYLPWEYQNRPHNRGRPDLSRAAMERHLSNIGFEILSAESDTMPTGNQITPDEYEKMIEEARGNHRWTEFDATERLIGDLIGTEATESNLREYKDTWIEGNSTTISVIARMHGLPPEMLASVAWTEIGGTPPSLDDAAAIARNVGLLPGSPAMTSVGDVQIQARHIAEMHGVDPDSLGSKDVMRLRRELERSRALNLNYVARHIADLRDAAWPDRPDGPLSEDEMERLGYMYNVGFRDDLANMSQPVDHEYFRTEFKSEYGIDLVRKLQRMRLELGLN